MQFPHQWRERAWSQLDEPFDLIVLGGGVNGVGVFFDAAQRGLRVLLVEREDLSAGTSSRSSKLVHGGLRYLKQFHLRLTLAACRERDRHLRLDPHLVDPLDFVYPAFRGDRTPGWQVEMGLRIYDLMTVPAARHRRLSTEEIAAQAPGLPGEDLDRALVYRDARVDDARLVTAIAATAVQHGGWMLTRAEAIEAVRGADGRVVGARLRDRVDGSVHVARASLVVNCGGPWVDAVRELFGFSGRRVRPSRGSHLLFSTASLPLDVALTVPSPDDGRPVFFVPHPEGTLVGTTDLFHDGPLDDPRPSAEETAYLLRAAAAFSPGPAPGPGDVVGAFAGLRPVIDDGAETPSEASREEAIWHEDGLLSVAGGKLTTWRLTAEDTVDQAISHLSEARAESLAPCATAGTPLAGRAPVDLAARLEAAFDCEGPVAAGMARRLCGFAWRAAERADAADLRPLAPDLDLCAAEVRAHLQSGAVVHLSDLLLRRTRLGMWRPERSRELAPELETLARDTFGWSAKRWGAELERFERDLAGWLPPRAPSVPTPAVSSEPAPSEPAPSESRAEGDS